LHAETDRRRFQLVSTGKRAARADDSSGMAKHWLFALTLLGCTTSSSTGISTVTCPTDSTLTYTNFGSAFISNNCLSCHANQESPKLSTRAQVQANASRILEAAVYSDAMPEDAAMTVETRQQLGEWLACGAP
jgi:uncharacterized membrane protein